MVRQSATSSSAPSSQAAPTASQTPDDVARDLALAVALAREEADRAMAIQMTGGKKPMYESVDVKPDPASEVSSEWKPLPPPEPASEPLAEGGETLQEERTHTPPRLPDVSLEAQRALHALYLTTGTRAVFVGGCAGLLSGVAILYLCGYSIMVNWLGEESLYHEPLLYSIASAVLYAFLFLLGFLGVFAAWRRSQYLVTAYFLGLLVATVCRVLLCSALTAMIMIRLPHTLLLHGCWSSQEGVQEPWSAADCRRYRAEAVATASLWGFSVLLCFLYMACALWLRTPVVKYEKLVHASRGPRTATSPNDTIIDDLEATLWEDGASERPSNVFSEAQNNARIQREFAQRNGLGDLCFEKQLISIVPEGKPAPGQPVHEFVKFTPVCPPPPAHAADPPHHDPSDPIAKGDVANSSNHIQVATWTASDFEQLRTSPELIAPPTGDGTATADRANGGRFPDGI